MQLAEDGDVPVGQLLSVIAWVWAHQGKAGHYLIRAASSDQLNPVHGGEEGDLLTNWKDKKMYGHEITLYKILRCFPLTYREFTVFNSLALLWFSDAV